MALSVNLNSVKMNLPAQIKKFCLNVKPFIEIFIVPKQIVLIHELTAYFSETVLQIIEPREKRQM